MTWAAWFLSEILQAEGPHQGDLRQAKRRPERSFAHSQQQEAGIEGSAYKNSYRDRQGVSDNAYARMELYVKDGQVRATVAPWIPARGLRIMLAQVASEATGKGL